MKHPLLQTAAAALALTALAAAASFALPDASADDPLVSLSYLTGSYRAGLLSDVDVAVAAAKKQLSADFTAQATALLNPESTPPDAVQNNYETLDLSGGQTTAVTAGGELLLISGQASAAAAGLVDATAGTPVAKGTALTENHLYVASADSSVQSGESCRLLVKTS